MKKTLTLTFTLILTLTAGLSFGVHTFECDDVEPGTKPLPTVPREQAIHNIAKQPLDGYFHEGEDKEELVNCWNKNPFMRVLYLAYDNHYPVVFTPDGIWLLISQGVAAHTDLHHEELRNMFVKHEGKIKLSVETTDYGRFEKGDPNNPWNLLTPVFAKRIKEHVGDEFYSAMVPKFTTTRPEITTAYEITLMKSMDAYFEYECTTRCGIPKITIEGTPEDWEKIRNATKSLKKYNADKWVEALDPILCQFEEASRGDVDRTFWQNMYKHDRESGGPYINGWIINFFPYIFNDENTLKENPHLTPFPKVGCKEVYLTDGQFPSGIAQTPFNWRLNGIFYNMKFSAGFIGVKQDKNTLALCPKIGWFVIDDKSQVEQKELFIRSSYRRCNIM